mmetsp:Transcript_55739/g.104889  ORF Transcript_55739/g.104889 Transcript_55739/m.104889 type:complete len:425 (+) Transcript_55739:88-1362(+)
MHAGPQRSSFRGDFTDCHSHQDSVPPAWLLKQPHPQTSELKNSHRGRDAGLPLASIPCEVADQKFDGLSVVGKPCDVNVDVFLKASPSFERGADGTYIMDLPGLDVNVTTSCNPAPKFLDGITFYRPQLDLLVQLPGMQRVVFDPRCQSPASLCKRAAVPNHLMVLELPREHSLDVKLNTDAPRGRLTIEDVQMVGNRRQVFSDAILNYEVIANGRLSLQHDGRYAQVHIDFDFEFRCWLGGSVCGALAPEQAHDLLLEVPPLLPQPASHFGLDFAAREKVNLPNTASTSAANTFDPEPAACQGLPGRGGRVSRCLSLHSEHALNLLSDTHEQLLQIEQSVADITLALQGRVGLEQAMHLKSDLSQLEAKAKRLETKGIDDVYTGELNSGRQLAKDTKKDMLRRLEELFVIMEDAFRNIKAKQG